MGSISSEIKDLLMKYHGDTKLAIKEEPEHTFTRYRIPGKMYWNGLISNRKPLFWRSDPAAGL